MAIKKHDLREYNGFVCYRAEYTSYKEAKADGAVYSTGSDIDGLTIDSDNTTGFFDIAEVLSVVEACFGDGELIWGVVDKNDVFVKWEEVVFAIKNQ